jgi:ATP-dependent DNA helicase RecG
MNEAETRAEQKLQELIAAGYESEVVEFKEAKKQYDFNKLGKYFSALSNEANLKCKQDAWLVFGIEDANKSFVNTQFRTNPSALQSLKKEIADKTTQRISFIDIHELKLAQGRVVMFQIPAAPQGLPISFDGHYYGRDGESLGALNIEEIERIRSQKTRHDWSAEIVEDGGIDDLCPIAITHARKYFSKKHPNKIPEFEEWDNVTFLNKAKLCIKGRITRAALLLLGKPEAEHLLNPGTSKISWILKDNDNVEKDYKHFTCPLIISVYDVFKKIRFLKYRYLLDDSIFPEEVDQYAPFTVREALNNCIAHQDYTLGGKITVTESEGGFLVFSNAGDFIPLSVEEVITADAPESLYRNKFLADAMVNLDMIDTIGSGIKKMFNIQKEKFFPLPDYDFSNQKVSVKIVGKVMDLNYARKLASMPDLSLLEIMALDRVSKKKNLHDNEIQMLRSKGLVEGRRPNLFISGKVARVTGEQSDYMKQKGIEDAYAEKMIQDYLKEFGTAKRGDLESFLLDKLPGVLSESQKKNKVKNLLQKLKKNGVIEPDGKQWKLKI